MNFTFTKTYLGKYAINREITLRNCRKYDVFNGKSLIASLYLDFIFGYFEIGEKKFKTEREGSFFKKSKYFVIDIDTGQSIFLLNVFDGYSVWMRPNSLDTGEEVLKFENIQTDASYNIFKKSTWGKYGFRFYSEKTLILYNISIDSPGISMLQAEMKNATGNIQSSERTNLLFIVLGLFLLEQYIEVRSSD